MSLQKEVHGRNLAASVKEIPILLPLPFLGDIQTVDEDDMGKNDPDTTKYINIQTNNIPPGNQAFIKHIEEMLDLTHRWLDIHAGIQTHVQKANGNLPTDKSDKSQLMRTDYRIKVVDTIMTEGLCGWINFSKDESTNYNIKVKKAEFHTELLKDMLQGITTVSGISDAIEDALKSISNIIIKSKDLVQDKSVWSFFNVFTWDDVTNEVKGSIRIVWYKISAKMVKIVVGKGSYEEIELSFDFRQTEFTFVDSLWKSSENELKAFLTEYGNMKIRDPINGEITP